MLVVTGGMDDGKNYNGIVPDEQENPIGKTPRQNPPDFGPPPQQQMVKRAFHRAPDCRVNLQRECQTQARLAFVIPQRSLGDVRLGFIADDEAAAHVLSRARMRASTSSHELPASGSFS